jgi:spore coat protein JB
MTNQMNQAQLLHWIDMVSFAALDMSLYLDTHSCDEEAMKYFNHYTKLRREALEIYARQYGPLLVDLTEKNTFDWADMPLPWEGGGC